MTMRNEGRDDELRQIACEAARPQGIRVNGVAPGPVWTALQVTGGATQEKLRQFGIQPRSAAPGSPRNWGPSMSSLLPMMQASQQGRSMAPLEEVACLSCGLRV